MQENTLTENEIQKLRFYLSSVVLTVNQCNSLCNIWLDGNSDERIIIAKLYPQYFSDPTFISKLTAKGTALHQKLNSKNITKKSENNTSPDSCQIIPDKIPIAKKNRNSSIKNNHEENTSLTKHSTKLDILVQLRTQLDKSVSYLQGAGPFHFSFGTTETQEDINQVIKLYQSQFKYPDKHELKRMIVVHRSSTTRCRQIISGNFTFFLKCHTHNKIACATTVHIHNAGLFKFIEMPLFATAVGYTKWGLAKLLTAALKQHCININAFCIMISADPMAVPFWCSKSLGFTPITSAMKQKLSFFYANDCANFKNSQLLTWEAGQFLSESNQFVSTILNSCPLIQIDGVKSFSFQQL